MADDFPILEGTVDDLKEDLDTFEGDFNALLEAEKEGKDK